MTEKHNFLFHYHNKKNYSGINAKCQTTPEYHEGRKGLNYTTNTKWIDIHENLKSNTSINWKTQISNEHFFVKDRTKIRIKMLPQKNAMQQLNYYITTTNM